MRKITFLILSLSSLLLADPPNAGPGWRTSKQSIIDQWDQMSPSKQIESLTIEYSQSATGWWATMNQADRSKTVMEEQKALNQMTKDQRRAFMSLSPKERQDMLFKSNKDKENPGNAATQAQQQQLYNRYNYTPPPQPADPNTVIYDVNGNPTIPNGPGTNYPGNAQPPLPGEVKPGVQQPNYTPPPTNNPNAPTNLLPPAPPQQPLPKQEGTPSTPLRPN